MIYLPPRAVPHDRSTTQGSPTWYIYHPGQSHITDLPPRTVPHDISTTQGSPRMTAVSPRAVPLWQPYFHAYFINTWFGGSPTMTLINLPHAILIDPCTVFRGILATTELPPCYFDWSLHSFLGYPTCGKSTSMPFWLILAQCFGAFRIPPTTNLPPCCVIWLLPSALGGVGGCSQMVWQRPSMLCLAVCLSACLFQSPLRPYVLFCFTSCNTQVWWE